ncbi:MAG: hypothetical protein LBP58_03105 [Azoarcus sp.]|jgi:hypothetical protein|nr:hypothetical protein [Azoarcus sp.]
MKTTDAISLPAAPVQIDDGAVQAVLDTASEMDAVARAVAVRVGYQLPADSTNPDLIQRDIAANMRRSVDAVLEIGRGLVVLKQVCAHGSFSSRLQALGIEPRLAQRFMQSAMKFSNASTSSHLLPAIGSQSKLFELLVLDDGEIEELAETGQTGNLQLDKIDCMSVSELRKTLRERDAAIAAKEKVLQDKDKKINDLQEDAIRRETTMPGNGGDDDDHDADLVISAETALKHAVQEAKNQHMDVLRRMRMLQNAWDAADETARAAVDVEAAISEACREVYQSIHRVAKTLEADLLPAATGPAGIDPLALDREFWRANGAVFPDDPHPGGDDNGDDAAE